MGERRDQRLVLIGEAPGAVDITSRPETALTGDTGLRLAKYAGLTWPAYLRLTDRHNLFYTPREPWPARDAEARAVELANQLQGRTVLLLGSKVADAFGLGTEELYRFVELNGARYARIPHPSGRNRLLNSTDQQARLRRFLHVVLG